MHWRLIRLTRPFICFSISLAFGLEALQTLVVRYGRFLALTLFDCGFHCCVPYSSVQRFVARSMAALRSLMEARVTLLSSGDYSVTACMWNFQFLASCVSIWKKILGLLSARSRRKRVGFCYPGSWFTWSVRLQTLLVKIVRTHMIFILKENKQIICDNVRVSNFWLPSNGRFDFFDAEWNAQRFGL